MSPSTKRIRQWERLKRLLTQLHKDGKDDEAWCIVNKLYHVPREVALQLSHLQPK